MHEISPHRSCRTAVGKKKARDCGALGESALPCYALRTGGDWLWIAARPEASPHHATARRRRYIDNHQREAFLIASGGGEGRILGLPFARSARQIGGISPHHNCRTAPKRKEGPEMRYSHAVASRDCGAVRAQSIGTVPCGAYRCGGIPRKLGEAQSMRQTTADCGAMRSSRLGAA